MVDSKNLVLHGVGEAVLLDATGKATASLMKLQSMTIEISAETEDVYGGDSLFAFYNYIKSKSASFKFKNATCDLNVLAATQGSDVVEGAEAFGNEDIVVSDATKLSVTTGIDVDSVIVLYKGKALKRVTGTPTAGEFAVTAVGALTFGDDVTAGDTVHASYVYEVADGTSVHVTTSDVPGYVELRHTSQTVELKDGSKVRLHTRVYKARCEGGFSLEYTRDGAVAPEVSFKSVDPERADKRFVSYSLEKVA